MRATSGVEVSLIDSRAEEVRLELLIFEFGEKETLYISMAKMKMARAKAGESCFVYLLFSSLG